MQANSLTDRIDIYNEDTTRNDYNETVNVFNYAFNDRCQPFYQGASERAANGLEYAGKVFRFKVRFHLTRYNERQLIKWRNDYYNIRGIDPDAKRTYLIITGERAPLDSLKINAPV